MATQLTAGTLTVTITESLTIDHSTNADDRTLSQTNTHTFASVLNIDSRVINLSTTNETVLANFSTVEGVGQFIAGNVKYIRITNLDDSNSIYVGYHGATDTAWTEIKADSSTMFSNGGVETADTFASFDTLTDIKAKAASVNTQLEIVVASS